MRKTVLRLEQIEAKLADSLNSLKGVSREQFMASVDMRDLALMRLQAVGEALNAIHRDDKAFVVAHAEIPWRELRGFRNAIVHDYFNIDAVSLWKSCSKLEALLGIISNARTEAEHAHPARHLNTADIRAVKQAIMDSRASESMKQAQLLELEAFLDQGNSPSS